MLAAIGIQLIKNIVKFRIVANETHNTYEINIKPALFEILWNFHIVIKIKGSKIKISINPNRVFCEPKNKNVHRPFMISCMRNR